jgi:hypothetical protein
MGSRLDIAFRHGPRKNKRRLIRATIRCFRSKQVTEMTGQLQTQHKHADFCADLKFSALRVTVLALFSRAAGTTYGSAVYDHRSIDWLDWYQEMQRSVGINE